jgi:RHS repeat-associated protein
VLAAWNSGTTGTDIRWLIADQLGTPRIILDQSGSLASTTRHDYLPFGEELSAGGRSWANGYTNSDARRQKFTSYERDDETGLDFAQARYHSKAQGRFTSADPLLGGDAGEPQSWNRYSYVINNPLNLIDPLGLTYVQGPAADDPDEPSKVPLIIPDGQGIDLQVVIVDINADKDTGRPLSEGEIEARNLRKTAAMPSMRDQFDEHAVEDRNQTALGRILSAGGIASSISEYRTVSPLTGAWRGANGQMLRPGWGGNGATASRSLAMERAGALGRFGKILGGAGMVVSIVQGAQAYKRGDKPGVIKATIDLGFGAAGTFGGPYGAGASAVYFGVDATVGWPAVSRQVNNHPMITVTPSPLFRF